MRIPVRREWLQLAAFAGLQALVTFYDVFFCQWDFRTLEAS